ncbi:MAG TPA: cytochrome b/b6 domain-containing protein [Luteibacter sp.]|uniref:cytochrome b/b6 domain-containing protein n=1 Tax=Luteibacter sp. TaxID=1886636 RepID=UPI002C9BEA19|nr:cytochrome b/b6 domain-containing protein [Luteibacter sp.]HVI56062.1 cytochrome b/b6 domain-containing protein [Luteibacter sp.]
MEMPIAQRVYRHRWPVRVLHWVNVICLTVLLGSGLQIFNAHPSLSWGQANTDEGTWLAMGASRGADNALHGATTLFGHTFRTDGVLGASVVNGHRVQRGFPAWATIPGPAWLALGRRWHFFFAWVFVINGLLYLAWSIGSGHFRKDLVPTRRDLRGFGQSVWDHLRLRHPQGDEALRYNVLQRLAYLGVIAALCGIALMGMAMSPRLDAAFPWLVDWVGGRQSARSIHFLLACALVAFLAVHLFEVLISGVVNQVRSMITGFYTVKMKVPHE